MIEPIRLLAFAFAGADLLFEIDREGAILFSTGATSLFSAKPDLVGHRAVELFLSSEQSRFTTIARGLSPGGRAGPLPMTLASGEKSLLSMCFLPDSDRISCTLVKPEMRDSLPSGKDLETGLGAIAMVNVPNLPNICAKLSPQDAVNLMAGIGANISAMGYLIAARLSRTRFGVITEDPRAARNLADQIQGAARERGLESLKFEEALLSLKGRNLTPEQNVLALRYVVSRFAEGKIKSVPGADLAEVFDKMMDETLGRAKAFNATVADGAFDLAFEPIVDLKTGLASHYEALTRFQPGQSTAETVCFAENLGLTDPFDMVVSLKAFSVLESDPAITTSIAINISGRSLSNPAAFAVLAGLLKRKRAFAKRVLIEITESAEITDLAAGDKAIQSLRQMGYRVGIDDFGSGAASLQYLHGFTVDFVKVDGGVIRRLGTSPREDAFLKSVLSTCAELKIKTVAEWIDSPEKLERCRDIGFHFGQGRQFGPSVSELPKAAGLVVPRARSRSTEPFWQ
jgi:EAL domain-containing protein (putative c-di-GMP-specific phosphodiesterase class I)